MTMGMVAMAGATLVGGALAAHAASKASNQQANAAQAGIDTQNAQFDKVQGLLSPFVQAATGTPGGGFDSATYLAANPDVAAYIQAHPPGSVGYTDAQTHYNLFGKNEGRPGGVTPGSRGALGSYMDLIGLNGSGAQQAGIDGIQNGAEFGSLAHQGQDAILQAASATGGLRGGNAESGLATFRSNLLSSLIDKQLGRLGGVTQMGQNAAAGVGTAALATGQANAGLLQQQGAAEAGGTLGATNAITNSISGVGGLFAARQGGASPIPSLANNTVSAPSLTGSFGSGTVTGFAPQPRIF